MAYWLELDDNQLKAFVENPESIRKIKKIMKAYDDEKVKQQTKMGALKFSSFNDTGEDWTEILEEYQRKKEEQLAEEQRLKEEEKKGKAAKRKTKKVAEKKTAKETEKKKESQEKAEKQISLDDFL